MMKVIVSIMMLMMSPVWAAVFSVSQPDGPLMGAFVDLDLNGDDQADITFNYYDITCVGNGASAICRNGVLISFGPDIDIYGSTEELGGLTPTLLTLGTDLGPNAPETEWATPVDETVSLMYRFSTSDPEVAGYPAYTESQDQIFIGFRLNDEVEGPKYGWIDVDLEVSDVPTTELEMPEFNGVYLGENFSTPVTVISVPEPSLSLLLSLGTLLVLFRRRR